MYNDSGFPQGKLLVSYQQTSLHCHTVVVWCGVVWFYQGPHSVLFPRTLKIDWLEQDESVSHSQGLIHINSQVLL